MIAALSLTILFCIIDPAQSFAKWMMKDFCHLQIAAGAIIMNEEAEVTTERYISVLRKMGDVHFVALTENDRYIPGETLYIKLSSTEGQFVFDVITKNAEFVRGGCPEAQRINVNNAAIIMPHDRMDGEDVRIQAAWALGHQKVQITPSVVIRSSVKLDVAKGDVIASASLTSNAVKLESRDLAENKLRADTGNGQDVVPNQADKGAGAIEKVMGVLHSCLWYIVGSIAVGIVFVVYRLNRRGTRRMLGSKQSYD